MKRLMVLVLVLANGVYFAWSNGYLQGLGWAPLNPSEGQRVAQQIGPDAIRILSGSEIQNVEAQVKADADPKECLSAGPFSADQANELRKALETWPEGSWQMVAVELPPRWILYMGKYATPAMQAKKRTELEGMGLKPEGLRNPSLEWGLSLGSFAAQEEASSALLQLGKRGVHSAKVVLEQEASKGAMLRLPAVGESLKARLPDLRSALVGNGFKTCSPAS